MVFTAVEQRRIGVPSLTEYDTVVAVAHDFSAVFENILRVLPDTKNITVITGNSPNDRFWEGEIRREVKPFESRTDFTWTGDLSFEEILKQASELPPHSVLYWHSMLVDAAGVVHEGERALKRLHAVARAPIFSFNDVFFGGEIVGGPLESLLEGGRDSAAAAIRILKGEKAGDIKIPPIGPGTPKFDWRELQRWGISESSLPAGSEIYFRQPRIWEQYQAQVLGAFAALLLQSALITWLAYEHRRRHVAEISSRNAMAELTYMNRRAAAGELSASIAHEVNQPLSGITTSASAGLRWLMAEPPNIDRAKAAFAHIREAGHRAGDVITNIRAMFGKDTDERGTVDVNGLVLTVLAILRVDLQKNGVEVQAHLDDLLPAVEGNKVQLQQVILNLVSNAIEAMHAMQPRILKVSSDRRKPALVHVSISDTGAGIDPANVERVFGALFTTKERGMGMGLSICKSIMENHHGRIWVSAGSVRGTTFHFELPMKVAGKAKPAERFVENA
jgi:signal transduction histidine kinase